MPGTLLLGVGVLGMMLALALLGQNPAEAASWYFIVCVVGGAAAMVAFWIHIGRAASPILPRRFIVGRGFGAVNLVNIICNGFKNGAVTLLPLYAMTRFDMSALNASTLLAAQALAAIIISPVATMALRRTGYRRPIYVGSGIIAVGMLGLVLAPVGPWAYTWLAASGCLVGAGAGVISPASRNAGLQLEPGRSASLAALRTLASQVGVIATVSVATAVITLADDSGTAQVGLYVAGVVLLAAVIPIATRITEHRGSW